MGVLSPLIRSFQSHCSHQHSSQKEGRRGKLRARKFLLSRRDGTFPHCPYSHSTVESGHTRMSKGGWAVCSLVGQACPSYIYFLWKEGVQILMDSQLSSLLLIAETT